MGRFIGWVTAKSNNRNRRIATVNINLCFPHQDQNWRDNLVKHSLEQNSLTLLESFWLWRHGPYAITQLRGEVVNEHLLTNAREKNQATIFVTPHFGSWEYAGLLTASCCDLLIMYAPPKLDFIHKLSYSGRSSTGGRMIKAEASELKSLLAHLKNGGSVGILPDQVPSGNGGVYAPFFERMTYTTTLVSKLAKRLDCEIVFCYSLRRADNPSRYDTFYYSAPNELYADTEHSAVALNKFIEQCIVKQPEQYLWSYKRFKRPPPDLENPY